MSQAQSHTLSGTTLDSRYLLEAPLGEGAASVVYRARHLHLDRAVAVKVQRTTSPEASERFAREARALAAVLHPNVIGVSDYGLLSDGRAYLVMELLDGDTLEALLDARPLFPERARALGVQIAEGLRAIHARSVLHRDLKPSNLFVVHPGTDQEQIKIIDFGIARAQAQAGLTLDGMVMGTPEFMAPEQCRGQDLDVRADIYAVGCILYAMLTGEPPFVGTEPLALLYRQLQEPPVPPRELLPQAGISAELEAVVLRALAKDREGRFPTAEALAQALRQAAPGALQPVAVTGSASRVSLPPRRWVQAALPLGVAALGLCAVLGLPRTRVSSGGRDRRGPAPTPAPVAVPKAVPPVTPTPPVTVTPTPVAALPAPAPAPPPADAALTLALALVIDQPPSSPVALRCGHAATRTCVGHCQLHVPAGERCTATSPGFHARTLTVPMSAPAGRLTQHLVLTPESLE